MIRTQLVLSFVTLLLSFSSLGALALDGIGLLDNSSWQKQQNRQGYMLTQFEGDSFYDPFVDYSEVDEMTPEEEADVNFFSNGRLFTLGSSIGYCSFTKTLGDIYSSSVCYGFTLNYFINLRTSIEFAFTTSDHTIDFTSPAKTKIRGTVSLTSMSFRSKYYLNIKNITNGLAPFFNPYFLAGFSQVYRTATLSGQTAFSKEGAMGFNVGGGLEIPLMRKKMYLGSQFTFNLINFRDENSEINLAGGEKTGLYPTGDLFQFLMNLGINF